MLGVTGWPGAAHAAAAKGGILSLSRTLAVEWGGDNIRVNTISPGPIGDTEGVRKMYIEGGHRGRGGEEDRTGPIRRKADIANAAVFLASDLGAVRHRRQPVVDGGLSGSSTLPPEGLPQ